MRILFFILGSIESRIVNWGLANMKDLLEEDIVFFGPIAEQSFNYGEKEIPLVSFHKEIGINDVFNKLPDGWFPDVVCCDVSTINYIPDIHKCPAKTLLLARDTWGDIMFNPAIADFFDFVRVGVVDRPAYKNFNSILCPLIGTPAAYPEKPTVVSRLESRKTDVLSIANYGPGFYHERYKTFYSLVSHNPNIKVRFLKGLKRKELQKYYSNAKIVIDWSHTLSNRSFEAALNGCLLFSNEENNLISEFWKPWREYIPYNEQSLNKLVSYYLDNQEEAQVIADNMQEKMNELPKTFGGSILKSATFAKDTEVCIKSRIERIKSLDKGLYYHRTATVFYFNYNYKKRLPKNWQQLYLDRIDKAILYSQDSHHRATCLTEAARLSFLLNRMDLSLQYLNKLESVLPIYAWVYYLKARIHFANNDNERCYLEAEKAINNSINNPELINDYIMPFVEKHHICDARRINEYLWRFVSQGKPKPQSTFLTCMSYELLGDANMMAGNINEAEENYLKSISAFPVLTAAYKSLYILIKRKEYEQALNYSTKILNDAPYDTLIIYFQCLSLFRLGKIQAGRSVLSKHLLALKPFKSSKKEATHIFLVKFLLVFPMFRFTKVFDLTIKLVFKKNFPHWFKRV